MAEPLCPVWLSFTLTNFFRRLLHDPVRILGPFVREGDTVLDVGCGPGFFTVPMARLAGERGLVVAVDRQPEMLEKTRLRAERAGVDGRIRLVLSGNAGLRPDVKADFALVFWTAHEVEDLERFFGEIRAGLKAEARLLLVEPRVHVPPRRYDEIVSAAARAGFEPGEAPGIRWSRAAVLRPRAAPRSPGAGDTGS